MKSDQNTSVIDLSYKELRRTQKIICNKLSFQMGLPYMVCEDKFMEAYEYVLSKNKYGITRNLLFICTKNKLIDLKRHMGLKKLAPIYNTVEATSNTVKDTENIIEMEETHQFANIQISTIRLHLFLDYLERNTDKYSNKIYASLLLQKLVFNVHIAKIHKGGLTNKGYIKFLYYKYVKDITDIYPFMKLMQPTSAKVDKNDINYKYKRLKTVDIIDDIATNWNCVYGRILYLIFHPYFSLFNYNYIILPSIGKLYQDGVFETELDRRQFADELYALLRSLQLAKSARSVNKRPDTVVEGQVVS